MLSTEIFHILFYQLKKTAIFAFLKTKCNTKVFYKKTHQNQTKFK